MKKVVVIGANGFLGTNLSLSLSHQGYQVIALVDKRFPYDKLSGVNSLSCIEFSLENLQNLYGDKRFDGADMIYHMAWAGVNSTYKNNSELQVQNVMYGLYVMQFAEALNIKRILVPGSAAECSCGESVINGNNMPAPSDMYSASKAATHLICDTYCRQHGLELIWTQITSIYGPGRNDNNLITYAIKSLLNRECPSFTGLEQEWDYLYIDDLIEALIALGENGIGGKVYPIGSGTHQQMNEYVRVIRDLIDPSLPVGIGDLPYKNPDKIDNQIMDISELHKDTGFVPKMSFEEGIARTIDYFRKQQS